MKNPVASVIVTTKNEEKYIESCLKSLKTQTFKDFEVIVSDAVSTDKTAKIAKRYADKVIVRKTNISEGRNLGASIAKGKILIFVDADTVLLPDTIQKTVAAFDRSSVVGAACPALPLTAEPRYVWFYMFYNSFARTSIKLGSPQIAGFYCAYRKTAFDEVKGFDANVGILEDLDLSKRIAKLGDIAFVDSTFILTSHRRLKKWGMKTPPKYIHAWLKHVLTGRSFSQSWYKPVR